MKNKKMLQRFIDELKSRVPEAEVIVRSDPPVGADYYLRVRVPEEKIEEAEDVAAELNYNWWVNHRIYILAGVTESGQIATTT